jgi:hypothetical protein
MNRSEVTYRDISGLGGEHLEKCVHCGQLFDLRDVRLDGDGQFRCRTDSFGPNPQSIAEANRLIRDYLDRKPELVTEIEDYNRAQQTDQSPLNPGV